MSLILSLNECYLNFDFKNSSVLDLIRNKFNQLNVYGLHTQTILAKVG